ncbi:hypothetical protein FF80_01959 [Devosia sp. LC5]|nr:hypothetical protein FF80_01959 [Devosia sp. LC5]
MDGRHGQQSALPALVDFLQQPQKWSSVQTKAGVNLSEHVQGL